jgi:hypothetical protein
MTIEELQQRIAVLAESREALTANVHAHTGAIEELERLIIALSDSDQGDNSG